MLKLLKKAGETQDPRRQAFRDFAKDDFEALVSIGISNSGIPTSAAETPEQYAQLVLQKYQDLKAAGIESFSGPEHTFFILATDAIRSEALAEEAAAGSEELLALAGDYLQVRAELPDFDRALRTAHQRAARKKDTGALRSLGQLPIYFATREIWGPALLDDGEYAGFVNLAEEIGTRVEEVFRKYKINFPAAEYMRRNISTGGALFRAEHSVEISLVLEEKVVLDAARLAYPPEWEVPLLLI